MKPTSLRALALVLTLCLAAGAQAAGNSPKRKPAPPPPPPEPTELTGVISRVVDGDTFWLKTAADSEPVVVRIEGIDAPESCQPGGTEATAWLTEMALNRTVTVKISEKDEWGRTVGKAFDGSKDIGDRMVRDGHAWSIRYKYDRGPYVAEERMAKALKRGVHAADVAMMPRDFRQRHGPCQVAGKV